MARVYVRKFDWDDARARHAAGETYTALAREYGVSWAAVEHACDEDAKRRDQERASKWMHSGVCPDCGAPGRVPESIAKAQGRKGRCRPCAAKVAATTVREDALWCAACREWKPDDAFPHNRAIAHRRGRHSSCRPCLTVAKRDWRARNRQAPTPPLLSAAPSNPKEGAMP